MLRERECSECVNVIRKVRRQINKREKTICFHAPCENNRPHSESERVTPFVLRHSASTHIQFWLRTYGAMLILVINFEIRQF